MAYEIKNWKPLDSNSKVKGFFTLEMGEIEINSMTLVEGPKGNFVSFPQRSYQKDGETKYQNIVWMPDKDRREAFQNWALEQLDKLVGVEKATPEEDEEIPF